MERAPKDGLFNCGQVLCASVAMFTAAGLLASVSLIAELTTHFKVFYLLGAVASGGVFALRRRWRWLAFAGVLAAIHVPDVLFWHLPEPSKEFTTISSSRPLVALRRSGRGENTALATDFTDGTDRHEANSFNLCASGASVAQKRLGGRAPSYCLC